MPRRSFPLSAHSFAASLLGSDTEAFSRGDLSGTYIFSTISDALSKAYDATKETVSEVADKVNENVSDAFDAAGRTASNVADLISDGYEATRETVSNVADQVVDVASEKASSVYSSTIDTLSQVTETVSEIASDAYDATRETVSNSFDATRDYVEEVASGDREINYWKVLGGAAIGVGAVAAAPFTGGGSIIGAATLAGSLAGAGTIAVAVGAGVAGAVVASQFDGDAEAHKAGYEEGRKEAKAEHLEEVTKLVQSLANALKSLKEAGTHFNAIIALHAVAVATASCEGSITASKRSDIEMFIYGVAASSIPASVSEKIESLYQQPPTVTDAFALAKDSNVDMAIFDEIINLVVHANSSVHPQEAVFMQAWNTLRTA
ncbi:hypothetical protein [Pseudomonas sp. C9-3]|uniref:hypothetical protein n=1 Tax=Pseudomonas sp. C9-3 TaxID=3078264 RepID=UPI0028E591B7|nr:hypothetical protein [Pseudomonas sp. C9-3]